MVTYVHYMLWCFIFTSPGSMSSTEIYNITLVIKCSLFSFLNLISTDNLWKTFNTLTTSYKTVWQDIAHFHSKIIQCYFGIIRIKVKPHKTLWVWIQLKKNNSPDGLTRTLMTESGFSTRGGLSGS